MRGRLLLALVVSLLVSGETRAGDVDVKKAIANLRDEMPQTRRLAAETLGKLGPKAPPDAIVWLAVTLADDELPVRRAAATALLAIGDPALPALGKAITYVNRPAKLLALTVLARLGPSAQSTVSGLMESLKESDTDVRIHAASALQAIGAAAKPALPALIAMAGDTSNIGETLRPNLPSSVCEAALQAIKTIEPAAMEQAAKVAMPDLLKALKDEKQTGARQAAAYAVGLLGPRGKAAVGELMFLFLNGSGFTQSAAFASLQSLGEDGHKTLWTVAGNETTPLEKRLAIIRSYRFVRQDVPPAAVNALREFAKHRDPKLRRAAVDILGSMGPAAKAAIPDLVAALSDKDLLKERGDNPFDDDYAAARALSRIGTPALPALIKALEDDEPFVRWQATKALSYLGRRASKAIPELRQRLKERFGYLVMESVCALLRVGADPDEPLEYVDRAMKSGDAGVRWDGADIVARVGPRAKSMVPQLIVLLADAGDSVAEGAMFALTKVGRDAKDAAPAAAKLLKDGKPTMRWRVLVFLETLGPEAKSALPALIEALKDPNANFRKRVAEVISKIGPAAKEAVPALTAMLKQSVSFELGAVVKALGDIGPEAKVAVPQLLPLLKSNNFLTRCDAARALGDIGPAAKHALPALRELQQAEERGVRSWAVYALARITGDMETHVTMLMAQYHVKSLDEVGGNADAIAALQRLGPAAKNAVPVLIEAARGKARGAAEEAVIALGQIGPDAKEAVPCLIDLLRDDAASMREAAAHSLGAIGPAAKAAVPRLTELANEDEDAVADAAETALKSVQAKKKS